MISTLEEIFLGKRELLSGLAIDMLPYDWKTYPVIHLNMAKCASAEYAKFERSLPNEMKNALVAAGYDYDPSLLPSDNFGNAIDY